jgi:hypothetical protein
MIFSLIAREADAGQADDLSVLPAADAALRLHAQKKRLRRALA